MSKKLTEHRKRARLCVATAATPARRFASWLGVAALVASCASLVQEPSGRSEGARSGPTSIAGSNAGDDTPAGGANDGASTPLSSSWCAVQLVLQNKCQRCHGEPLEHGAPFPLLSYADTQVLERNGQRRAQRIAAAVASDFIPPTFLELEPSVSVLEPSEKELLLAWCAEDPADAGAAACENVD